MKLLAALHTQKWSRCVVNNSHRRTQEKKNRKKKNRPRFIIFKMMACDHKNLFICCQRINIAIHKTNVKFGIKLYIAASWYTSNCDRRSHAEKQKPIHERGKKHKKWPAVWWAKVIYSHRKIRTKILTMYRRGRTKKAIEKP